MLSFKNFHCNYYLILNFSKCKEQTFIFITKKAITSIGICFLEMFYALFGTTLDKIKKKNSFYCFLRKQNISSKKIGEKQFLSLIIPI